MRKPPLPNSSAFPIPSLLKRVMHGFRDVLDEKLRPHGITSAQLHVLAILDREPEISGAKLARSCMVTPQTMQGLIATTQRNGWITRRKHPENSRILLAALTPAGEALLASSRRITRAVQRQMLGGFSTEDAGLLEALLARCAENLTKPTKNQPKV